jgi:hypothetical protein
MRRGLLLFKDKLSISILKLEDGILILEYQTIDALLGLVKSAIKIVDIPLSNLTSVRIEQKLWSSDLILQGKTMGVWRGTYSW